MRCRASQWLQSVQPSEQEHSWYATLSHNTTVDSVKAQEKSGDGHGPTSKSVQDPRGIRERRVNGLLFSIKCSPRSIDETEQMCARPQACGRLWQSHTVAFARLVQSGICSLATVGHCTTRPSLRQTRKYGGRGCAKFVCGRLRSGECSQANNNEGGFGEGK